MYRIFIFLTPMKADGNELMIVTMGPVNPHKTILLHWFYTSFIRITSNMVPTLTIRVTSRIVASNLSW